MSYHFLCHNAVPLILQIPNILKYLDLILSILCVLEISETPANLRKWELFSIPQKSMVVFFI